jgi:hypothetical protein
MPNGLECDLSELDAGAYVRIGGGRLACGAGVVSLGPVWDPRPHPRFGVRTRPELAAWRLPALVGLGPGLTPLGDDVAIGYLAARALFGGCSDGVRLAEILAERTTSLSGTLLRLAARGCLPEAAHRLLEEGDAAPLLSWGATSGSGLLAGLGLFDAVGANVVKTLELVLPLDRPRTVQVEICRA